MRTGLWSSREGWGGGAYLMTNRQVFTESCTPNLRVSMERYRSVQHIPVQLMRGKVKQSRVKNLRLLGVGMRNGWNVKLI